MKNKASFFCFIRLFCGLAGFALFASAQSKDLRTLRDDKQSDGYVGVALVVGNSDYKHATKLNSPVNDASDMAKTLSNLGFKVLEVQANVTQDEMENAIAEFGRELEKNKGVGVFYYSGHGIQSNGINYLIPVDVNIPTEFFLKQKAVDLETVMATMEDATDRAKIIILDACRNDPFKGWRTKGTADKGLAKVDAPEGMLIAFATSPRRTAADGNGRNSPYTEVLLQEITKPNISISDMLQDVRTNLREKSGGTQISWENTSLLNRFCFAGCNTQADRTSQTGSTTTNNSGSTVSNNPECDPNCIFKGPKLSDAASYKSDGNSYRFYASVLSSNSNDYIEEEIKKLVAKEETHVWDDKRYYLPVPKKSDGLLLLWRNITKGEYGWVFIQRNANDDWFYKSNGDEDDFKSIKTGIEDYIKWSSNPVKIYFKIPKLENGWDKEDVQYKFGW